MTDPTERFAANGFYVKSTLLEHVLAVRDVVLSLETLTDEHISDSLSGILEAEENALAERSVHTLRVMAIELEAVIADALGIQFLGYVSRTGCHMTSVRK